VAVLYASAYGNTASLAQAISRGVTKAGVGVETLNLEQCGQEELEAALDRCSGFVLGSPTLGGHMPTQVQTALGTIIQNSNARQVPCSVFGSFGWSGEAVDMMERRLKDAGFRFAFDPVRCKFKPTEQTLHVCEESGLDLAQEIRRAQKRRERVAAAKLSATEMASGKALALGRVVGSLCVLTGRDGDARGAMLASWVSQASFAPPGLTVAVKRDRAMESMLPVGAAFNLNILAEVGGRGSGAQGHACRGAHGGACPAGSAALTRRLGADWQPCTGGTPPLLPPQPHTLPPHDGQPPPHPCPRPACRARTAPS
jgi:flavodoxin